MLTVRIYQINRTKQEILSKLQENLGSDFFDMVQADLGEYLNLSFPDGISRRIFAVLNEMNAYYKPANSV